MSDQEEFNTLREEVAQLLADALRVDQETSAETDRVQHVHDDEMASAQHLHDEHAANLERALTSRDLIGQAKGITMVALHCSADEAFELLKAQSQAQNRKLVDIAAEIADRAARRAKPS